MEHWGFYMQNFYFNINMTILHREISMFTVYIIVFSFSRLILKSSVMVGVSTLVSRVILSTIFMVTVLLAHHLKTSWSIILERDRILEQLKKRSESLTATRDSLTQQQTAMALEQQQVFISHCHWVMLHTITLLLAWTRIEPAPGSPR